MAKRIFATAGLTWATNALGSLAVASSYMGLRAPGASQLCDILEVFISGTQTASTIAAIFIVRISTNSASETTLVAPASDGGAYPGITALATNPIVSYTTATTQPTLSNAITDAKLNLSMNSFGGIVRWNAAPTQQWQLLGSAAPGANSIVCNLAAGTGGSGTANAHIIYEPY